MISRVDHGESVNWVAIMYYQLIKELIKWEKHKKKYDRGNNQKRTKKGCMTFCHNPRSFVSKVVSIRRSRIIGEEEIGKTT
jgi:hypothetical protein